MKSIIAEYFNFTRSERVGAFVVVFFCLVSIFFPHVYSYLNKQTQTNYTQFKAEIAEFRASQANLESMAFVEYELFNFDPNTASVEEFQRLGLSKKVANTIIKYRKYNRFEVTDDLSKIYTLKDSDFERLRPHVVIKPILLEDEVVASRRKVDELKPEIELFPFDPNTASEAELSSLGLPKNTVKAIVNYRSKVGNFETKTDLQKIYTLSEAEYVRLEQYIEITTQNTIQNEQQLAFREANEGDTTEDDSEPSTLRIDINQSMSGDWQQIRGIGSNYAKRIIQFRTALGGFISIEQVGETYGLPDSVFQQIKPYLIDSPILSHIPLNTATIDELNDHPYISWKQAKLLVNFRKQHGPYQSVEDIRKIRALKPKDIERFAPYLKFSLQ